MKKILSLILVFAMIAALLAGCGSDESAEKIAQLEQENAALKQQVEELTAQLGKLKEKTTLDNWSLTADIWDTNDGATVELRAVPVEYVEDALVTLNVQLNGMEAESAECQWNGTAYTATVELAAADGYSFYCILTSADGTQDTLALNTPENTTDGTLVYLQSALNSYANLILDQWSSTDKTLTINSGFIQVQTPQLTANGTAPTLSKAELVLKLNGEEHKREPMDMPAGEGEGSYERAITDLTFATPKMDSDDQLDMILEVTLSDGTTISATGGSWFQTDGELSLVVG